MGSSQESKDLNKFSQSQEGKSVKEIAKSNFEQNIYVCGNYEDKFFEDNITEKFLNPRISNIKSYEKMAKHKQLPEWHFFFAKKTSDLETIIENSKAFIKDHNGEDDLDDFHEKSKTRIGKTTIIYFNDSNKDKYVDYFISNYNVYLIPFIIFIGTEEETNQLKAKIVKDIKDKDKKIDPNIFKFVIFNENSENNLINLNLNLIECSAFYNELGDEFKFPKKFMDDNLMQKDINEIITKFSTFNILICGRPGAGKSSFINFIIKAMICKAGHGGELSKRIIKYIHREYPLTLYDTPGISTEEKIYEIIELIKQKNEELKDSKTKIHAIFYVINGQDPRNFLNFESKMFEVIIKELKIPIYFLMTRLTNEDQCQALKPIAIRNFRDISENIINKYDIDDKIFFVNVIGKEIKGIYELFHKVYLDFRGYINNEEITKKNIKNLTQSSCSLIGQINKPQDIVEHPKRLCEEINLTYRLIARSISSNQKGSTFLSSAFLRIITNIFGLEDIKLEECKRIIKSMDFQIDDTFKKKKKHYKSWLGSFYYDYKTPAEEEISYLAYKYINQYQSELVNDEEKCLNYINKLRENFNKAIESLNKLSLEYKS